MTSTDVSVALPTNRYMRMVKHWSNEREVLSMERKIKKVYG